MEGGGSNTPFYRGNSTALATNPSAAAAAAAAVFLFLAFSSPNLHAVSLLPPRNGEQNGAQKGDREAAIDAEIVRVNDLPAHSSYAIHRMKVLNKLRHLLSIKARKEPEGSRIGRGSAGKERGRKGTPKSQAGTGAGYIEVG
ncbi:hypothetical protein ZEAMMB73_Zm00001d033084 [Zea mays]|uniref:Uncharacterized protein n=1 Tax=Zea mays TaxID=4577 RepID=A0A1D6KW67_MAIZE|nr:hypothetical protein ZEAMMB73_Zm00001d033084 [Zea mays]